MGDVRHLLLDLGSGFQPADGSGTVHGFPAQTARVLENIGWKADPDGIWTNSDGRTVIIPVLGIAVLEAGDMAAMTALSELEAPFRAEGRLPFESLLGEDWQSQIADVMAGRTLNVFSRIASLRYGLAEVSEAGLIRDRCRRIAVAFPPEDETMLSRVDKTYVTLASCRNNAWRATIWHQLLHTGIIYLTPVVTFLFGVAASNGSVAMTIPAVILLVVLVVARTVSDLFDDKTES